MTPVSASAAASAPQPIDRVFSALGDPTRLAIVEHLAREGETSASDLAAPFSISKPAISRHLQVLEEAGLISRRAEHRYRYARMKPEALAEIGDWLAAVVKAPGAPTSKAKPSNQTAGQAAEV